MGSGALSAFSGLSASAVQLMRCDDLTPLNW
jgi:hypothetical protein